MRIHMLDSIQEQLRRNSDQQDARNGQWIAVLKSTGRLANCRTPGGLADVYSTGSIVHRATARCGKKLCLVLEIYVQRGVVSHLLNYYHVSLSKVLPGSIAIRS